MFSMDQIIYDTPSNFKNELPTHKASFRYNDLDPNEVISLNMFEGKKAVLFISVGQAYHEKGKFLATINLVNKYPFSQCDIVLADTLQCHNHSGRLGEKNAWIFAKEAGDQWLKRSEFALSQHEIPHEIIRWDDLLWHDNYALFKSKILEVYNNNPEYKEAIHANVWTYIERLSLINPNTDTNTLFNHGLNYLLEECPIVMPLWEQMGYDFIIYPKPLTVGMSKTRALFVSNKSKCQWIYLRFKKTNSCR